MTHIKWQRQTKLSHITAGKFLKNIATVLLVLISITPRVTIADGKPESADTSTTLSNFSAEENTESQGDHYDIFKTSDDSEKTHPRGALYKKDKFNTKSFSSLQQISLPIENDKSDSEKIMESENELYDKSKVFDSFEDFDDFEKTHNRYDIYKEDKFDQEWMKDLQLRPVPVMDVRAIGSLAYPQSVDQACYTNDIRYGRFYNVRYGKYKNVVVQLSEEERDIINFALTIVFMDAKYAIAYSSNDQVTLERLLNLAANIKYSENLDDDTRIKTMRVLSKLLYY